MQIKKVYTRHYTDNGQLMAYVEWDDGSRTEGPAEDYYGVVVPIGPHMGCLFDRALACGLVVEHQTW